MEIKIRYTFKRKSDGHIWQEITPIECLEGKGDKPFVLKAYEPEWDLIGRDLKVGHDGLYEGDIVRIANYETSWKHKEPDFDWRVFEIKWNQYTWALNNSAIYTPFQTYDKLGIPYEIEKIGDIYTTPELLK